jgi:hypothetical protein
MSLRANVASRKCPFAQMSLNPQEVGQFSQGFESFRL